MSADHGAAAHLNNLVAGHATIVSVVKAVTYLGSNAVLWTVIVAASVILAIRKRWRLAIYLLATGAGAQDEHLGAELARAEQATDTVALLTGRRQLRRAPEAPLQLPLDRGGPVLPVGGRRRQFTGIGPAQHLQAGLVEQRIELGVGGKVVALRRVVQPRRGGQVDQQADPAARTQHPAHLSQHGQLALGGGLGAQHTQGPHEAGRGVRPGQRHRVGLGDRGMEEPGRRAARARFGFQQNGPGPGALGRVGGRAADTRPDVDHHLAGGRPQPVEQPVQDGRLPAAPAARRDEILRAQRAGGLRRPSGHGVELGRHRVIDVIHERPPALIRRANSALS
ncbi:MAG: hypothetical protein ABSB76_26095 [Streptosporangiaceae bacterium]